MESLSALRLHPERRAPRGARFAVRVIDPKTNQEALITSVEPLEAFTLDDDERCRWPRNAKHPDALLIAQLGGKPAVVFLELTYSLRPRKSSRRGPHPAQRKIAQIDAGIDHFHPRTLRGETERHGQVHHDRWRNFEDLPSILPVETHRVGGIVLSFHHQTRFLVEPRTLGAVVIPRAVWSPVRSSYGRAEISVLDIARQLGWS